MKKEIKIGQAERVLKIMKMLCKSESVCIFQLMEQFNLNSRSIERDIKLLKGFFKRNLVTDRKGCYFLKESVKSNKNMISDEAKDNSTEEKPLLK